MKVSLDRTNRTVYGNGVIRSTYKAKVTSGGHTQSATVQRMVMPRGATPQLVTKKLGTTGQLRSQLDTKKGARGIAAVNGDFFYGYGIDNTTVYLPRNASVSHGKAVRLGNHRTRVVGVDKNGEPFAGEVSATGTVTHGADTFDIDGVNWHTITDASVVVFTRAWADTPNTPRPVAKVEWVVKRNTIKKIWTGKAVGRSIPKGSRVIAFGANNAPSARTAKVGTKTKIAVRQNTSTGVPLQEAVGRGLALVRDGVSAFSCTDLTRQQRPRTTVGWNERGRWSTLSLPGSGYDRNGYRIGGLGLAQVANVAKALGFVDAVELDGGGSTTAFVRRADNTWDRVDDKDSIYQRPIPNALVFVPRKK